jgi:hypothetical protein
MTIPGCDYCRGGPEPGWIETDNNGPIVNCPMCNEDKSSWLERVWKSAETQRDQQNKRRS